MVELAVMSHWDAVGRFSHSVDRDASALAAVSVPVIISAMGRGRTLSTRPDPFSTVLARALPATSDSPPLSKTNTTAAAATLPPLSHVLPKDLPKAIRQLQNQELDRLLAAVLAEQKRRGGKLPEPAGNSRKARVEPAAVTSLPSGKLNAVRAAFKAGVKPSQIARQFGISQADLRKALARDGSKA